MQSIVAVSVRRGGLFCTGSAVPSRVRVLLATVACMLIACTTCVAKAVPAALLRDLGISEFGDTLLEMGILSVEDLRVKLTTQDLRKMGVKLG